MSECRAVKNMTTRIWVHFQRLPLFLSSTMKPGQRCSGPFILLSTGHQEKCSRKLFSSMIKGIFFNFMIMKNRFFSEKDFLGKQLEDYVKNLPVPVHIIRQPHREGLIRARLEGAKIAKGEVLTFLDAHIEASPGWLEPLLYEIKKDRTNVICPIIDVISDDTFEFLTGSDLTYGGFNWKLNFRFESTSSSKTHFAIKVVPSSTERSRQKRRRSLIADAHANYGWRTFLNRQKLLLRNWLLRFRYQESEKMFL
jgi:hypothetical protein